MAISIAAVVIAALSLAITVVNHYWTAVLSRKPILVFEYDDEGWTLRNIGNGPAMNVVVARRLGDGKWFDPVRVPALAKDRSYRLVWCARDNIHDLGASYEDFSARIYTSMSALDLSRVYAGNQLRAWHPDEVEAHWKRSE